MSTVCYQASSQASSASCSRMPPPVFPLYAMVTKISKWFRIQDSCRIAPKIESPVAYATADIASKFQKNPSTTFRVMLLTHTHTQTDKVRQKHNLFGGGNNIKNCIFIGE